MTLTQAAFGKTSLTRAALMVVAGSLFIAVAAQISVPFFPVPLTLGTLAILIVGLSFGARLGAATVLAYLAQGAAGFPVFANGGAGLAYMAGPTLGFLLGYVAVAWITGYAADRGWARGFVGASGAALVASAVLYLPGVAWPMAVAGATGVEASWVGQAFGDYYWAYFVAPFLLGDAVKSVLAAMVVTGAWKALKARQA